MALALRLYGIAWALPDDSRLFSFHPDESMVVGAALRLNPFVGRLDPGFYNYGSLALLLFSAAIHLGEAIGLISAGPAPGVPSASALLMARLVTASLGAATCLFLISSGRRLWDERAGLWAGALYAVAPLAVQHGHFATVDVPATFFIAGSLFFAARSLTTETPSVRDLLWAGLWAGLAAATKYNAGLVLLAAGAAALRKGPPAPSRAAAFKSPFGRGGARRKDGAPAASISAPPIIGGRGGLVVISALIGFLIGCPGILLDWNRWASGFAFEAVHVRAGHGLVFVNTPPGFWYHIAVNLRWGLGLPLLLITLIGTGYALYRRRPADWMLLAFLLPYYLLIGLAQVKFARYTLPLFPPLLLLTGALLAVGSVKPLPRRLLRATGALAGAYALLFSFALDKTMTLPDTRDQAAAFVRSGGIGSVGFPTGPWYWSPTLHPLLTAPVPQAAQQAAASLSSLRLIPALEEWSTASLRQSAPDAVALSEFEYGDALRARHAPALDYLARLRRDYPAARVFAKPVQVFGIPLTKLSGEDNLPVQNLPHDMLYTNPTTVVRSR